MPEEKFDDLIGVKCHRRMRAALKRIASARGLDDTDLLRAAGMAIVEFARLYGDAAAVELAVNLGKDFSGADSGLAVADATIPYPQGNSPQEALAQAKLAFQAPLLPEPPSPQESPPSAGAKHAKKSPRKSGPK